MVVLGNVGETDLVPIDHEDADTSQPCSLVSLASASWVQWVVTVVRDQ